MTRRSQRYRRFFLSRTIARILFWGAGLFAFLRALPDDGDDNATATDAIVVLTGGSLRLNTGLTLLKEGLAERLFVSGVHRGVDVQQLLRIARQSPDAAKCCISLGHEADDTAGNADETSAWMASHRYRSIRLVTAAYHMPRSLIEFRNTMPDVRIITHPVFRHRSNSTHGGAGQELRASFSASIRSIWSHESGISSDERSAKVIQW